MDVTVTQSARARLITAEEQEIPVPATLRYTAEDPLAVHVDFPPQASLDGDPVSWTFARALLEEGLGRPAGRGDVRLWPCGRTLVVLEFHSPYGLALLQFDIPALRRFLLRTYAAVPAGQEDVAGVVDRSLDQLLGNV